MAAKRITQSSINWTALAERVPAKQKPQYLQFKSVSDTHLRKVLALPENPPAIDWATYKAKVPVAGMVDNFQKQYSALKIPYPPNPATAQLDALEKEINNDIVQFKKESDQRIADYKKQLAYIASLIPYNEMTLEDFRDAHPNLALDPLNRPTFWPHTPEDQPDYENKDAVKSGH